jgi:ADP-ribose pyrophosphatase YjhB (NUDIX family)
MLSLIEGNQKFNYRIAGILIHDGKVLLHREKDQNVWALPGGRGEMMEEAQETIVREMKEEIGLEVNVERLVWIGETFGTYKGVRFHELGLYFLLRCTSKSKLLNTPRFCGIEGDAVDLVFEWFPIDQLPHTFYPAFAREGMKQLPMTIEHCIEKED